MRQSPTLPVGRLINHDVPQGTLCRLHGLDGKSSYSLLAISPNISSFSTCPVQLLNDPQLPNRAIEGNLQELAIDKTFSSKEWYTFTEKYGFKHMTSNPHCLQTNNIIEQNVHAIKNTFTKAKTCKVSCSRQACSFTKHSAISTYQVPWWFSTTVQ